MAASADRISELPQPLLHHILCFLSQKQAVQTCVLSKSWRYLGSTRPNLEFLFEDYNKKTLFLHQAIERNKTFLSIVDKTLQRYYDQKLYFQEFHVEFRPSTNRKLIWSIEKGKYVEHLDHHPESILFLGKWFPFFVEMMSGIKTFDLSLGWAGSNYIDLPSELFENSKSLRNLRLCGFRFSIKFPMDYKVHYNYLKHLQTLTLEHVHIVDETFQNIMSSCPYIEHVILYGCEGLTTIRLMNYSCLQSFDLFSFPEKRLKEDHCLVGVPNLESMIIKMGSNWFNIDRHRNMYFPGLKFLHLHGLRLMPTRPSLDILSCDFPCLQHFYIHDCNGFGELRVSNRSIKHLTISCLDEYTEVDVDVPNIEVLDYKSSLPWDMSFSTTTNEYISNIRPMRTEWIDSKFFQELIKLLKAVSHSKIYLQLPLDDDKYDIGTGEHYFDICGGDVEPVPVECLHLDYDGRGFFYNEAIINRMFRFCRPRNILEGMCTRRTRFLCKMILRMKKEGGHRFSWQRDLEEASMQMRDQNSEEWLSVQKTTFSESADYWNEDHDVEVWLKLKWRE